MKRTLRVSSSDEYGNLQRAFMLRGAMIAQLTQRIGGLMQDNARLLDKNAQLRSARADDAARRDRNAQTLQQARKRLLGR